MLTLILGMCLIYAHAANRETTAFVTQLPVINELPSNTISAAYHDSDGFMWFGTKDGLCRYDGYRLKTWRSNRGADQLLTDNDISAIVEDKNHNLLIGTRHGMNVMNRELNVITHPSNPELADHEIRAIVPDIDNNVWIGTYRRLVRASSDLDSVKTYDSSLPVTSVNTVFRDNDDNIWVAFWEKGLYLYNRTTDRFEKLPVIGSRDNPMRMIQTGDAYLVGTWGNGLWRIRKNQDNGYSVEKINIENDNGRLTDIFGVTNDKFGNIWMISHSGLYEGKIYGSSVHLQDISNLTRSMNNIFNRIITDNDGNIWVTATHDGAYVINHKTPVVSRTALPYISNGQNLVKPTMTSLFKVGNTIWFNQPRSGLDFMDTRSGAIQSWKNYSGLKGSPFLKEVGVITNFSDNPANIYVGAMHYPCIYLIHADGINSRMVDNYPLAGYGKDSGSPRVITKDHSDNLWIATDKHLLVRASDNGEIIYAINGLRDVQSMQTDNDGYIWIASPASGVIRLKAVPAKESIRIEKQEIERIAGIPVVSLGMDTDGNTIWAISKMGHVFKIDRKTLHVQDFTDKANMRLTENLQDLIIDKHNNKWLSTSKLIFKFNPEFDNCVQYNVCDVQNRENSLNKGAFYYDAIEEYIYYGCNGGYVTVNTDPNTTAGSVVPPPVISDIKIQGTSIFEIYNGKTDFSTREIYIPSDARDIKFELSTLQYANADNIRYSYRLKGFENEWATFDGGAPLAFYNHIPSGTYTLEIRATDENGQWGEISSYTIHKVPSWYETWWAYLIYALIFCVTAYILYRYFKKRITEKNEIRLAQLDKKNTEELTEMKLKYFANISHDFLTPITIISCLIDDIETVYGKIGPHLDKIRFNLTKVKSLIQQILDYRKMETGNMRLSVTENDLCDFIDRICRNHFQPLMDKKHINFNYDRDCEPIVGYFDVDKVEKILFNLISNAYKYTPDGGSIDVHVRKKLDDGKEFALIKISDTGVGISKKNIEKIFNRFYTVGRDERVESNGIGLSLVKDLLELHHGSISVESTPGKGSVFTLCFPVSKECFEDDEIADINSVDTEQSAHLPQDLDTLDPVAEPTNMDINLLLVEDNEELLSIMSKIFARSYHVLVARNGKEALDVIEKNDVDIIVSDVMMPEMDGLELCNHLKSDIKTSHVPIILLTAKSRPEDRVECYKAGADGYIAKPFELPVLVARIDNFIKNKQNRQEKFKDTPDGNAASLELSVLDKEFLDKVISLVNEHIEDDAFDIDALANEVCMSRSSLYRKIKVITGMSPVELVRNTKLKRSYELLKEGRMNISQVAYAAGFSNPKYFSTCFKEQFGISPRDVNKS